MVANYVNQSQQQQQQTQSGSKSNDVSKDGMWELSSIMFWIVRKLFSFNSIEELIALCRKQRIGMAKQKWKRLYYIFSELNCIESAPEQKRTNLDLL